MQRPLTCVEICAGAGGQALGLAMAGFVHVALVEYEADYCEVLRKNRPEWNVICADVHDFDGRPYRGVDLLAGGVPCPPFSVAGKQLGQDDERDLFPEAIRLIREIKPKAVMLENVRGFLDPGFETYRSHIFKSIQDLGYVTHIKLLNASNFGVPQLRPRVVIIGIRKDQYGAFSYPEDKPDSTYWTIHFDGSRQLEGSGAGVVLTSPRGDKIRYVLRLMFPCTNNAAEYEALLHGLRVAKEINLSRVRCFRDSDLVAQQVSGTWDSKDPLMAAYRREVDIVAGHFKGYQVEHVDRRKNKAADALSQLGSQRKPVPPNVFLDILHNPSVKLPTEEDLAIPDLEAMVRLFMLFLIGQFHIWLI